MSRSPIVWVLAVAVTVTVTSCATGQEGSSHAISITDGADFSDLAFLTEVLKDKRLVLLGESNHGSREFNLQKNRLVRFLHEELGFGVLLLESGMGEVYSINYRRGELSERQMISAGLVGPWRTLEYAELMKYLKKTPELHVGGYDVQRSGRTFGKILAEARVALGSEEAAGFEDLEDRFSDSLGKLKDRKREADDALTTQVARLMADYTIAHERIESDAPKLMEHGWTGTQLALVLRTIRNRLTFLEYYTDFKLDQDFRARWTARDTAMADNVIFFAKELFPDEKLIVSGHNFHITKFNEKEQVMGEILAKTYGSSVYAIGFFAGKGSYVNNSRKPEVLDAPTEVNDIRHVIRRLGKPSVFVDIPAEPLLGSEWLFAETFLDHTFLDLEGGKTLNLSKAFDGLVLIGETTPAQFPGD